MKQSHDERLVDHLRDLMLLPWRTRPAVAGKTIHPGIQSRVGTAVLQVGAITARGRDSQAEMVRFAVVAANALPRLLEHCRALERQLGQAGLELEHAGVADEILAQLELAGWADEGAPAWRA